MSEPGQAATEQIVETCRRESIPVAETRAIPPEPAESETPGPLECPPLPPLVLPGNGAIPPADAEASAAAGGMRGHGSAGFQPAAGGTPALPECGILPELPPPGIPPELLVEDNSAAPDLATIVAEMSALKQEVKLQARTFKKLQELLQAFVGTDAGAQPPWLAMLGSSVSCAVDNGFQRSVRDAADILDENRRDAGGEMDAARDEGFMQAADALMDARDKLAFGIREARRELDSFSGLRAWFGGRDVLGAALKGQELALARLDDALLGMDIEALACVGMPFDPDVMCVVETVSPGALQAGTIVEIIRQGYARDGETLRTADVKVAAEK